MITNTKKKIQQFYYCLENGKFTESPKNSCYEWCPHYWDFCRWNPKWLDIKHALDDYY